MDHIVPKAVFGKLGGEPGEFRNPWAVAVDRNNGNIHVADSDNKRICVYNQNAVYLASYDLGCEPRDLCFTVDGDVAVTGRDDKITLCDASSGTIKRKMGQKGSKIGEFNYPCGITTDVDGTLFVCDRNNHRVQVLGKSGCVVNVLGGSGRPGELDEPISIAIHPHSRDIYVVDMVDVDKDQVNIYSSSGVYKDSLRRHNFCELINFQPSYVTFNGDGVACVSDISNNCVHAMHEGKQIGKLGKYGTSPGLFNWPRGATFTDTEEMIICDTANHRVQIFSKN